MRVVFDAGDCRMDDGTEDDSFREGEDANLSDVTPQPLQLVDVSKLIQSHLPDISVLDDMVICPPLQHFKFSSDDSALDLDFFKQSSEREQSHVSDSEAGDAFDFAAGADGGGQEDFFADEAGGADFGNSGDGAEDFFEAGGGVGDDDEDQEAKDEQGYYVDATAQPARGQQQQDPIVALAENSGAGVFDYFDTAFSKNWAGPQHWKMRRAPPAQRKGIPCAIMISAKTHTHGLKMRIHLLQTPANREKRSSLSPLTSTAHPTSRPRSCLQNPKHAHQRQ